MKSMWLFMKKCICKSEYSGFDFLDLLNGVNILNGIIPMLTNKKGSRRNNCDQIYTLRVLAADVLLLK